MSTTGTAATDSANHLRACLQKEEGGRMDLRDYDWSSRAAVYNFLDTKERQKEGKQENA